jgi:hypothetical protein
VNLEEEADRMTRLLQGKTLATVRRHQNTEIVLEFSDGTRLFVNNVPAGLEFSVTETEPEED